VTARACTSSTSARRLSSSGLTVTDQVAAIFGTTGPTPSYDVVQLGFDRRLLLNRKRELQMWRVWLVRPLRSRSVSSHCRVRRAGLCSAPVERRQLTQPHSRAASSSDEHKVMKVRCDSDERICATALGRSCCAHSLDRSSQNSSTRRRLGSSADEAKLR